MPKLLKKLPCLNTATVSIYPATVKGIPDNYKDYTRIDSLIVDGEFSLGKDGIDYAVIGQGVAWNLGVGLTFIDPIRIVVPKKGRQVALNQARAINYNSIFPSGIFAVLEEVDSKYILVPFNLPAIYLKAATRSLPSNWVYKQMPT
jgi:lipoprotein-releasing system permease protein